MKRIIFLLALTTLSLSAFAYTAEIDGIYYNFNQNNNTAVVTSGDNKYTGSVTIPETVYYEGVSYTVTIIGDKAFYFCGGLTSISFPKTIVRIDYDAFYGCNGLKEVHITDLSAWMNVQCMGGNILRRLPTGYSHCIYLNGEEIKQLTIPEDITSIRGYSFFGCSNIESVNIHSNVSQIKPGFFYFWGGLSTINVDANNAVYDSRNGCNAIIETAKNTIVVGSTTTVIPDGITGIGDDAFYGREGLTSITFPSSVTWIGEYAFEACNGLTTITIPNNVTTIGSDAFFNCDNLTEVRIGNHVQSVGEASFRACDNLTDFYCSTYDPPSSDGDIFYGSWNVTLHVPIGCKDVYATAPGWSCENIVEDDLDTEIFIFPDCPQGETRQAALYLNRKGIVQGEEGLLLPNREASRAEIAKISLYGLAEGPSNIGYLETDDYPSVYTDLQDKDTYYYRAAKKLLYLDYGDGVTPFDRNRLAFEPEGKIARDHVLKVMMETFNIQPDLEGTDNPFPNDEKVVQLAISQPRMMGYIRKAAELGVILTDRDEFRPYAFCTRGEAFLLLARIMKKKENCEIDWPEWAEESNTFQPLNTTLRTIALGIGLEMGNFQHYTKTSFDMDGVVPLTFSHSYNSYNTTLPSSLFGDKSSTDDDDSYKPLGDGWSHTYHSFITVNGSLTDESVRAIVHWGGGNIEAYKPDGSNIIPESVGVYNQFSLDGKDVVITTKSQVKYRFTKQQDSDAAVLHLTTITDRNGNTLTINYEDGDSGSKRISSVTYGQRSLSFSYLAGTDLLEEVTDPINRRITFTYFDNQQTGKKQLQSFTDAEGNTTTYEYADMTNYGSSKLLSRIQLPKGNYIENEYDANYRLAKTVSGINGVPTTETNVSASLYYYGGSVCMGSQVNVTRDGHDYTYYYDYDLNNMPCSITSDDGLHVEWYYGDETNPTLPTYVENNRESAYFDYDMLGNVTSFYLGALHCTMTYDDKNNLTSITNSRGYTTEFDYDEKGNLTEVVYPEGVTTSIKVDSKGLPTEVTNAMNMKTLFEHNSYGNLTKTTLPALNLSSSAIYDDASRLTSVTDALQRTTSFEYNNNDCLSSITDPMNHTTTYAYDLNNNLISVTNAKNSVTTLSYDDATDWLTAVEFGGATKRFNYYEDGTMKTFTKPDGTVLNYSYDAFGLIRSDGVKDYTYDTKQRLVSVAEGNNEMTFGYDYYNRITSTNYNGQSNNYEYDNVNNCTRINDVFYDYDGLNRLTSINFNRYSNISYDYRLDGQLSSIQYPNGMTTQYGYDEVGRLISKSTTLGDGTVIADYSFTLDNAGNVIEQEAIEPYQELPLASKTISYEYDEANRITKAGNIGFTFDANGNLARRDNEAYTWNANDHLKNAGGTEIIYDPLGNITSYGDITFTTDPRGMGHVLSDSKSGAQYIYGLGLEARLVDGAASFYVTDMRGSVVAIVDQNGTITHKYQYDEFGNVLQKEEADYNPFQYVGKYGVLFLNEHLYYMRARNYDPTIGRFISEDPIWSTNLYPYTGNNPIMGIDPEGELSWSVGAYKGEVTHYGGEDRVYMTGPEYPYGTYFKFEEELTGDMGKIMDVLREAKKYKYDGENNHFYTQGNNRIKSPSKYLWGSLFKHISKEARQALKNNYVIDKDEQYILNRDIWGQETIDVGREIYGGITSMGIK